MAQVNLRESEKVNDLLEQAGDLLWSWSREKLQANDAGERSQADTIFALVKDVGDLRRRIIALRDGRADTTVNESNAMHYVEKREQSRDSAEVRLKKSDYPKYFRRGRTLIKVGLTRDKTSEYKHFLPELRYNMIVELVANAGRDGKEFTTKDLLKDFDGPSNYLYNTLALLHRKKAVAAIRRGIYKLENEALSTAAESIWKGLPEEFYE